MMCVLTSQATVGSVAIRGFRPLMANRRANTGKAGRRRGRGASEREATLPPHPVRKAGTMNLTEIRPGLFLNVDQIVSVRVLPQEEDDVYAVLQLSNGDKQNVTRAEFTAITGEEPRLSLRLPQTPPGEVGRQAG